MKNLLSLLIAIVVVGATVVTTDINALDIKVISETPKCLGVVSSYTEDACEFIFCYDTDVQDISKCYNYEFAYKKSSDSKYSYIRDYAGVNYSVTLNEDGSCYFNLNGLTPGTKYIVKGRVKEETSGNYSAWSDAVVFTTSKLDIKGCSIQVTKVNNTYTGKAIKPSVKVVGYNGEVLIKGKDYKSSYSNNVKPGIASIVVSGIGKYRGASKVNFYISSPSTKISKVTTTSNSFNVYWNDITKESGYQVAYKKVSDKSWNYLSTTRTYKIIKGLSSSTKYVVKVRSYKVLNGTKVYSSWSGVKCPITNTQTPVFKGYTSTKNSIKITWGATERTSGYQLAYKKNKDKKYSYIYVKGTSKTINKLKDNTKYLFRVRSYAVLSNGNKKFSSWSPVKSVNTKKLSSWEDGKVTKGEKSALSEARAYLKLMPFSKNGLIKQLEYEDFTYGEAMYGVLNCGANWNNQAIRMAESYLAMAYFTEAELIKQLVYEGFTQAQAEYGVSNAYK